MAKFRIGQTTGGSLDAEMVAREIRTEPEILMICVSEFFTAASHDSSLFLAKVSQCAKVILRRCMFRHLKSGAILLLRRLLFSLTPTEVPLCAKVILRRCMFRRLKRRTILVRQRKL